MNPMEIRLSKGLAAFEIVVGVLLVLLSLLGPHLIGIAAGTILTIGGILMLVNPIVRVEPNEVQMRNLLGMTLKRFPVNSPADLRFVGKALWHVPTNKKIVGLGFGFDDATVARLRSQIPQQ